MQQLPDDFIAQIRAILPDEADSLLGAIATTEPSVAIRVNDDRGVEPPTDSESRVPWCAMGKYLQARMPFTFDVDFQTGRYYVQDASSMFIYHVIKHLVKQPVRYLDLCAAPGGKTTTAISALPAQSVVVANEIVGSRARVLRENVVKWGSARCIVTGNAPSDLGKLTHFFDVVATDVPCSGEGMMRKDEEARRQWTPALVKQCAALQKTIIHDIWHALRPGGLLIYSTCTYNRVENEQMVAHIVEQYGAESVEVPVEPGWNIHPAIDSPYHCYRFMPHRTRGEGLFMAVLRKPDDERRTELRVKKSKGAKAKTKTASVPRGAEKWLTDAGRYAFGVSHDGEVTAIPADMEPLMTLFSGLHVLHAGVEVGTVKGKSCVPSQSLALSTALNAEAFARCEVDYATAMAYMRGEAIVLHGVPKGYVLLTYKNHPLGFVNHLGNRANNLYPKAWRVLSTHLPSEPPVVL